jgi:hypothetical protein
MNQPGQSHPTSLKPLLWLPVAVLLVEAALHLLPAGFMVRSVRARMAEILSLPAPRVQIMGDSVSAAINSANLAEAAGLPVDDVDNYSLPGTSPVFAYYALQRELAGGRKPEVILFAPHPANLETPMIDRFIGRFGTARECVDLLGHGVSLSDWLFGAACRVSIAMRYREEFRAAITEGNFGFFTTLRTPVTSVLASRSKITGPVAAGPASAASDFPAQLSAEFVLDPVNATYIDLFCDLAAANGIQVKWVTVPVAAPFNERAMGGGAGARYEAFLQGLTQRHPNVTLLHPQIEVYPDDDFADPWHLNQNGTWRFSTELGAALKGR